MNRILKYRNFKVVYPPLFSSKTTRGDRENRNVGLKLSPEAIFLIISLAVIFLAQAGCGRVKTVKKTEFIMGTRVSISVPGNQLDNIQAENNPANTVFEKGFKTIREVDALLSNWRGNSQVSQLNKLKPGDRKSTRLNSSHIPLSRMPSSA